MNSATKSRKTMDMTTGSPLKLIIVFGLPILIGNVFQQLYSMVDSIVVGNFVGNNALAAVGATGQLSRLLIAAAMGLTTGASIVVSQLVGAKQTEKVKATISTTLTFTIILSIVLSIVGAIFARQFCIWTQVPEEILDDAALYLRIYMYGMTFMLLYNFFAAVLRSLGDSTTPLIFLIISSVLNIAGDLWLVIGHQMGVEGVAIATVASQGVSVVLCIIYVHLRVEYFQFHKGEYVFDKGLFKEILRLGIPSALQGSVMSLGFVLVQGLINSFGPAHIAAYTAASKMEQLSHLPVESFTMGFSVYVGQNMGAGKIDRTKDGMKKTFMFTGAMCIALAVILIVVGDKLVELFVDSNEEGADLIIGYGAQFLRTFAPFTVIFAGMNTINSTLRGSGDSFAAMVAMMFDLGMRVVAAYILCSFEAIGFLGIAISIPVGWVCSTIVGAIRYKTGKWQQKTVKLKD